MPIVPVDDKPTDVEIDLWHNLDHTDVLRQYAPANKTKLYSMERPMKLAY